MSRSPIKKTHDGSNRPPFECIALLLQGGGALGAYQAGVYQALAEADLHPDWVAGISIGAINAAIIAGNAPTERVDKLRAFTAFHVTYHMTRKREVFIANSELRSLEPKNYEEIVALRGAYEQRLAEILSEGVAEGEFEVVDVQVATFAILALLTGLTTWYRPGGRLTKEAIVAAHEKLVLSSVAPGATPDPARTKRAPSSALTAPGRLERR
jgi:hypothetical protein